MRDSGKHPNHYTLALGVGRRCGLVVVASMVQRARAAGDGRHALLPTEAAMGPAETAPEGAKKTRNAYVGRQIQRTAQRAARKKCASPSSKTKSDASGRWEERGGAPRRLVMGGDGEGGGGECDGRTKGDLRANNEE